MVGGCQKSEFGNRLVPFTTTNTTKEALNQNSACYLPAKGEKKGGRKESDKERFMQERSVRDKKHPFKKLNFQTTLVIPEDRPFKSFLKGKAKKGTEVSLYEGKHESGAKIRSRSCHRLAEREFAFTGSQGKKGRKEGDKKN